MAKIIEITNPLTGQPQQVIQSYYTAQQIDDAVAAVQPLLPGGPGLPVNQGGTGANTPQLALANLGGRPNKNLLDNWYFVGGGSQQGYGIFPVNQNGNTNYTTQNESPITIDRWTADWNLSMEILENGISMEGAGIFQFLSNEVINAITGNTITISALYTDWTLVTQTGNADQDFGNDELMYRTTYGGGKNIVRITGNVAAVKLEIGNKQTLAYQKDNQWRLFETPDYAENLLRCQRYLYKVPLNRNLFGSTSAAGDSVILTIDLPVEMRTVPVITDFKNCYLRHIGGQYGPFTPSVRDIAKVGNQIIFQFDNPDKTNIKGGTPLVAFTTSDWFISAEL